MFLNKRFEDRNLSELRKFINKSPENVINLGLGEIKLPLHPKIKQYLYEIIQNEQITYTPNAGLNELKEIISSEYDRANVCVTCGAEEAIFATLFSVLSYGDEVLIANPGYLAFKTIIELCNAKPIYFDMNIFPDFTLDRDSFTQAVSEKTKAIVISNPSNPTGKVLSSDDMKFIKTIAEKRNILLVIDEIYAELYLNKPLKKSYEEMNNIVVISGISKTFSMAGWRLGWVVSYNKKLIEGITVAHQYIATCAPTVSQKVAVKILKDKQNFVDYYRLQLIELYDYAVNFLRDGFQDVKLLKYDSAPYIFVNFGINDVRLAMNLQKNGVLVIPGSFFGSNGENWIRINYAIDKNKLEQGLKIIKNFIQTKNSL